MGILEIRACFKLLSIHNRWFLDAMRGPVGARLALGTVHVLSHSSSTQLSPFFILNRVRQR